MPQLRDEADDADTCDDCGEHVDDCACDEEEEDDDEEEEEEDDTPDDSDTLQARSRATDDSEDADGRIETPPQPARPPKLADEIRQALGLPSTVKLRFREDHGGWATVDGDYLGKNVPTIRAAAVGVRCAEGRHVVLNDGSRVPVRMVLEPDVEAARRAITQLRRRMTSVN